MAQRVQVLLVCDLHEGDVAGEETISFALDGRGYEIDLCNEHAAALRDAFAPYAGAARRASAGGRGRARRGTVTRGIDPAAVRAWARSNGIKVSERGRISSDVVEQFTAAGF